MIFARPFPDFITRTERKTFQDLILSVFSDKTVNCAKLDDFDDLEAEKQTLWLLGGKQISSIHENLAGPQLQLNINL